MNARLSSIAWLVGFVITLAAAPVAAVAGAPAGRADVERVVVPLHEGRLEIRSLLLAAYEAMDLEPPRALAKLQWTVDVESMADRARLDALADITGGALTVTVEPHEAALVFDRVQARGTMREARSAVDDWVRELTDGKAEEHAPPRVAGITFVTDADERLDAAKFLAARSLQGERVVVLIHGLDDPGWMWRDMILALHAAGYVVARMEYPNDGPIADAADLFASELMELRGLGVERLDVVAHSMGGLVTRDVLTRPAYYASDASGGTRFPAVDRFIMCGTPNHGSSMARLRAVSELKEHLSRAYRGRGAWLGSLSDGRGEAAIDLLPDSQFLRRLNARTPPKGVAVTIIAGRMSPVRSDELDALGDRLQKMARSTNAPAWMRRMIARGDAEARDLLDEAVRGLGDGCVTLDSARLKGVDDVVVVEANHVSMIVDALFIMDEPPPSVPVVLDRLQRDPAAPK